MNLQDKISELDNEIADLAQKRQDALQFAALTADRVAYLRGRRDMLAEMAQEAEKAAQEPPQASQAG